MVALLHSLLDPAVLIAGISGLATFLAAVGLLLPYLRPNRMEARLSAIADQRRELRSQQLDALKRRSSLRRIQPSQMRAFIERIRLRELVAGEDVRRRLLQANWRSPNAIVVFTFARLLSPLALGGLMTLMMFGGEIKLGQPLKLAISVAAVLAGFYLPNLLVTNAIQRRQIAFQRAFPDAMDLLTICVESGLSIEAAFSRVAQESGGASPVLAEEFELTTAELAYLPDRRQAYENLAVRMNLPSVRAITTALIQAEKYGTPLALALRVAAQESRDQRVAAAEKKAAALPAKLTVPMVVFFLPVLFVVILGPTIIQIINR